MNLDYIFEQEVQEWHRTQGGSGIRAAGHALRILRECVELCVAAGASETEIKMAVRRECDKAGERGEFGKDHGLVGKMEEFVDVTLLMKVFEGYFLPPRLVGNEMRRKLEVCRLRQWQPDADGVLWRPGTAPGSGAPLEPKSS